MFNLTAYSPMTGGGLLNVSSGAVLNLNSGFFGQALTNYGNVVITRLHCSFPQFDIFSVSFTNGTINNYGSILLSSPASLTSSSGTNVVNNYGTINCTSCTITVDLNNNGVVNATATLTIGGGSNLGSLLAQTLVFVGTQTFTPAGSITCSALTFNAGSNVFMNRDISVGTINNNGGQVVFATNTTCSSVTNTGNTTFNNFLIVTNTLTINGGNIFGGVIMAPAATGVWSLGKESNW